MTKKMMPKKAKKPVQRGGWTHPTGGLKGGAPPKLTRSEFLEGRKEAAKKAEAEKARGSQPPSQPQPTPMEIVNLWQDAASEASDATMDPARFSIAQDQALKAQEVAGRSSQPMVSLQL